VKVVIVDTGAANLLSLRKAISQVGFESTVTTKQEDILGAEKIFLPGVGAFAAVMKNLKSKNLDEILRATMQSGSASILGICLGMQILGDSSEEGAQEKGLSLLSGISRKLESSSHIKVPHVGFNNVKMSESSILLKEVDLDLDFYFVHSYAILPSESVATVGITEHGVEFTSVIENGAGIFGVQFHPEKSNKQGLKIIQNFLEV
jgi:glutamine amidotransferase